MFFQRGLRNRGALKDRENVIGRRDVGSGTVRQKNAVFPHVTRLCAENLNTLDVKI